MVRKILQVGDPLLSTISTELTKEEITSQETQDLYQDLVDTCMQEKDGTAGLSAVQIGIPKRIYVIRRLDLEKDDSVDPIWEVMINPDVEVIDDTPSVIWEGCMSVGVGEDRLFGPVARPRKVKVRYYNLKGERKELVASGYVAHIIQHEQDHLNGVLFLKYVANPKNIWKNKVLDSYLEKYGDFPATQD